MQFRNGTLSCSATGTLGNRQTLPIARPALGLLVPVAFSRSAGKGRQVTHHVFRLLSARGLHGLWCVRPPCLLSTEVPHLCALCLRAWSVSPSFLSSVCNLHFLSIVLSSAELLGMYLNFAFSLVSLLWELILRSRKDS